MLRAPQNKKDHINIHFLMYLSALPQLRVLQVQQAPYGIPFDLTYCSGLTQLRQLQLPVPERSRNQQCLSALTGLQDLRLTGWLSEELLAALSSLTALTRLVLVLSTNPYDSTYSKEWRYDFQRQQERKKRGREHMDERFARHWDDGPVLFQALQQLKQMKELGFSGFCWDGREMNQPVPLAQDLPHLTSLTVLGPVVPASTAKGAPQPTFPNLLSVQTHGSVPPKCFTGATTMKLDSVSSGTAQCLRLAAIKPEQLVTLYMAKVEKEVPEQLFLELGTRLPQLRSLTISREIQWQGKHVTCLSQLTALTELALISKTSCTTVDDAAWGTLLQLGELEELALMGMGCLSVAAVQGLVVELKKLKNFRFRKPLPSPPLLVAVAHQVKRAKKKARRAANISKQADERLAAAVGGALSTEAGAGPGAGAASGGTAVGSVGATAAGQSGGAIEAAAAATTSTAAANPGVAAVGSNAVISTAQAALEDGDWDEEVLMAQLAAQTRAEEKADRAVQMAALYQKRAAADAEVRAQAQAPRWSSVEEYNKWFVLEVLEGLELHLHPAVMCNVGL